MKRIRKHPRINLRFKDHYTMNELELAANKQGLTLPSWIKQVMAIELQKSSSFNALEETALESILIARKHMEDTASEDKVQAVRCHVRSYIEKIKNYATH